MALTKPIIVPFTKGESDDYRYIDLFQLTFRRQELRMDTLNYVDKAAFLADAQDLGGTSFILPKEGLPALDDQQRRLHKKVDGTYVLESEKDNPDAATVVPTYPEVPPMMQFVMSIVAPPGGLPEGTPIFGPVMVAMYNLLASRPEFAGSTVVDV